MIEAGTERARTLPLDEEGLEEVRLLVRDGRVERMTVRGPAGRDMLTVRVWGDAAPSDVALIWVALGSIAALAPGCAVDVELRAAPATPLRSRSRDIPTLDHE